VPQLNTDLDDMVNWLHLFVVYKGC